MLVIKESIKQGTHTHAHTHMMLSMTHTLLTDTSMSMGKLTHTADCVCVVMQQPGTHPPKLFQNRLIPGS